jgi:hypothetical protein
MTHWTRSARYGLLLITALTVAVVGCSKDESAEPSGPAAAGGGGEGMAAGPGATDEVAAALAELSDEDRALAEKQKICLVSDEPLGSMGTPIKVTVNGRDVFLCCAGCKKPLEDDPDKYLAKLAD